jgi:uncharacterized RDD family membrane protein YckC/signal peptidase I
MRPACAGHGNHAASPLQAAPSLAPLPRRALALALDFTCLGVGQAALVLGVLTTGRSPAWLGPVLLWGGVLWTVVYVGVALVWLRRDGQSPGKKLHGLVIRGTDGAPVSLTRIVWLRNVLPVLCGRIPIVGEWFFALDHAFAIRRADRRTLHDMMAGTQVLTTTPRMPAGRARLVLGAVAVLVACVLSLAAACMRVHQYLGPSMEPALLSGDRVVGFIPLPGAMVERGDVIVFRSPLDGELSIKRVLGMPGDLIEALPEAHLASDVHVPAGHVFVIGDNLSASNDSRNPAMGPVPIEAIESIALSIYWSAGPEGLRLERMPMPVPR